MVVLVPLTVPLRPVLERLLCRSSVWLYCASEAPAWPFTRNMLGPGAVDGRSEFRDRSESFGKQPGMESDGGNGGTGGTLDPFGSR